NRPDKRLVAADSLLRPVGGPRRGRLDRGRDARSLPRPLLRFASHRGLSVAASVERSEQAGDEEACSGAWAGTLSKVACLSEPWDQPAGTFATTCCVPVAFIPRYLEVVNQIHQRRSDWPRALVP